ncbi:carbohydrate ABC transporter permease [Kutzneria sp. NPDC051319]|uniref:carbohydrate ABC transporter permease n=1 Tax=Kutzneria sp. NPDC051319 TaxID=3155047 RepID=UPI0034465B5A
MTTPALPRRRARFHWRAHAVLLLTLIVMIYPLVWLVGASFKPENLIFTTVDPLPFQFTIANYVSGWTATGTSFSVYLANSATVSICVVVGNLVSCSMAAYAFARLDFALRRVWFALMLGTLMLPFQATLIPQYTIFYQLNWINTFLPLVVPYLLAYDAFFIFLMVQFIRGIPRELDEAAALDGAGQLRVFLTITVPLLRPALITTGVLTFIWTFNDFLRQLVYLSDNSRYTVPLGLNSFIDKASGSSYGGMLAMSVVTLVPTVAVFLISQRRLVDGVANTGIK